MVKYPSLDLETEIDRLDSGHKQLCLHHRHLHWEDQTEIFRKYSSCCVARQADERSDLDNLLMLSLLYSWMIILLSN